MSAAPKFAAPKFTPGPWTAIPPQLGTPWVIDPHIAYTYGSNNALQIERARRGELEANARLIAAAPELYEALRAIVDAWDGGKDERVLPVIARAALAKVSP